MKKPKKFFSVEQKQQAVDDYTSGRRTVAEIAAGLGVGPNQIYRWKIQFDEQAKGERVDELEAQGMSPAEARRFRELEAELDEYKKKLAEQTLISDLLKKLFESRTSRRESELTSLINTTRASAQKRKLAK